MDKEIEKLKADIFSNDKEKMKIASSRIFEIGGQSNINFLIGLLDQENSRVRDVVALTFRDNGFNDALEPLFKSIRKKEFKGYTGTMVYALEKLDCSKKFNELFDLLFDNNSYEVQNHILNILDEQEFEFTADDLIRIRDRWDSVKEDWDKINHIDSNNLKQYDLHRGVIQDFVDGYLSHLTKSK